LDRNTYTIDISGLDQIHAGERITINATGGGQSYGVITANRLGPQRHRLQLDVGSILGRARIAAIAAAHLELDFFIITRTARLHHARLERDADHTWSAIAQAANRDADSTTIQLHEPLANVQIGDWVSAVAYVVGDPIHLQAERDGVPLG
jgi:hypothetical protein